jgi:Na+-transporting NADH:ubiquinone oxidoreductase subunit D
MMKLTMKLTKTKAYKVFKAPLVDANPVSVAVLGICSALAVTTQMIPSIVMVLALTSVLALSNVVVSFLRHVIPKNIRIIVFLVVIASLVILADQLLKAFLFDVSKQLSVFVGLIITNCIIMGRAEAFAVANTPWLSFWDGVGNGFGYGYILIVVAFFRELLGAGSLFGIQVIPEALYEMGYVNMGNMLLAPGVFVVIGLLVWAQNSYTGKS